VKHLVQMFWVFQRFDLERQGPDKLCRLIQTSPGGKGRSGCSNSCSARLSMLSPVTSPEQSHPELHRPNELLPGEVSLPGIKSSPEAPCKLWHFRHKSAATDSAWGRACRTRSESGSREHGAHRSSYMQLQLLSESAP